MRVPPIIRAVVTSSAVALIVTVSSGTLTPSTPWLKVSADTPADVGALARRVHSQMRSAFPARSTCLDDVSLQAVWSLDDRARYDPSSATILLRIPATAAQLSRSVVHELAHHLEFHCPAQSQIRTAVIIAQLLPADTAYFGGPQWSLVPSEHFASIVVAYVLGRPDTQAGITVRPASLETVQRWATHR